MVVVTPAVDRNAVAAIPCGDVFRVAGFGIGGAEVAVEVFLTGQVGAPRGFAGAAVVKGAEAFGACGIGICLEKIMTGSRADDFHRGVVVDAAVEGAVGDDVPSSIRFADFHDCDALQVLQFAHVFGIGWCAVLRGGEVGAAVGVFMVDCNQFVPIEGESFHSVGVFTENQIGAADRAAIGDIVAGTC